MGALSFSLGYAAGVLVVSPAEWLVHKYMLHRPADKRIKWLNERSSRAHNDVHHSVYSGPEHYYRDFSNKDEVIHFSNKDRATILASGLGGGAVLGKAYSVTTGNEEFDAGVMAGFTSMVMLGYAGYEFTHHYMHVIGERRNAINKQLGDLIQDNKPDGRLRFSKPLLDDVCNAVERFVDSGKSLFKYPRSIEDQLYKEYLVNKEKGVTLTEIPIPQVLDVVGHKAKTWDEEFRSSLSSREKLSYSLHRGMQKVLRSDTPLGRWFVKKDNNHFVHHKHYLKNLNVFMLWADKLFGTRVDSSRSALINDQRYWLCPNSPN